MDRNSKETNFAKFNLTISVDVLTLPVAAEPTLQCTCNLAVTTQRDCLEETFALQARGF